MATNAELEQELKRLQEKQRALEDQLRTAPPTRPGRPDASLTDILKMENGHTQWARTRYVPLVVLNPPGAALELLDEFGDAATRATRLGAKTPADWVSGTSMSLNVFLLQTATGGSPTAVLRSTIQAWESGGAITAIETAANANATMAANALVKVSRTVTASTSWGKDSSFRWSFSRVGGDAGDTVNATVYLMGAWLEYTAFM